VRNLLVFLPAIGLSCLVGMSYMVGKEHGARDERNRQAVRRAYGARLERGGSGR